MISPTPDLGQELTSPTPKEASGPWQGGPDIQVTSVQWARGAPPLPCGHLLRQVSVPRPTGDPELASSWSSAPYSPSHQQHSSATEVMGLCWVSTWSVRAQVPQPVVEGGGRELARIRAGDVGAGSLRILSPEREIH